MAPIRISVAAIVLTGFYSWQSVLSVVNFRKLDNIGLPTRPVSEECNQIAKKLEESMIDAKQLKQGIIGGILRENDCKRLSRKDLLGFKTQEEQSLICSDPCYTKMADFYSEMLRLNCFDGADRFEAASGKLRAGEFRLACQKNMNNEYCVPIMTETFAVAAADYELCPDIIANWGCCFGNYQLYFEKFGLNESATAVNEVATQCAQETSGVCPCANSDYAGPTDGKYVICAGSAVQVCYQLLLANIALLLLIQYYT